MAKKMFFIALFVVALAVAMGVIAPAANAWSDASLGTYPYVPGGVATKHECVVLMHKASTQSDWRRMMRANDVPNWAQDQIIAGFQDPSKIRLEKLPAGTRVSRILVHNGFLEFCGTWDGPSPLRAFTVGAERTTTVTIHGNKMARTEKWRSAIPIVCGNGLVYNHNVKTKPIPKKKYPLYGVKQDPSGLLLCGFKIVATNARTGQQKSAVSITDGKVFLGNYVAGTKIIVEEQMTPGQTTEYKVVSPENGMTQIVKSRGPQTVVFVNEKIVVPPSEKHGLWVGKFLNVVGGQRVGDVPFYGTAGSEPIYSYTSPVQDVMVANLEYGETYDLWEVVPANMGFIVNHLFGTMPAHDVHVAFVNFLLPTPPPTPSPKPTPTPTPTPSPSPKDPSAFPTPSPPPAPALN
jgi:hypothetical protein